MVNHQHGTLLFEWQDQINQTGTNVSKLNRPTISMFIEEQADEGQFVCFLQSISFKESISTLFRIHIYPINP